MAPPPRRGKLRAAPDADAVALVEGIQAQSTQRHRAHRAHREENQNIGFVTPCPLLPLCALCLCVLCVSLLWKRSTRIRGGAKLAPAWMKSPTLLSNCT